MTASYSTEAKYTRMMETPIPRLLLSLAVPYGYLHADLCVLQHGRYLFYRQAWFGQRYGSCGRVLPNDGDLAGGRVYVRAGLRQLHRPGAGRAQAGIR